MLKSLRISQGIQFTFSTPVFALQRIFIRFSGRITAVLNLFSTPLTHGVLKSSDRKSVVLILFLAPLTHGVLKAPPHKRGCKLQLQFTALFNKKEGFYNDYQHSSCKMHAGFGELRG